MVTAINTLRADMLLYGYKADSLASRLQERGIDITAERLKKMIKVRQMPAILYLQCLLAIHGKSTLIHLPSDLSELI